MPLDKFSLNLFDLLSPLAKTVDLMSPYVADHHMRVAYLAFRIAAESDVPVHERSEYVLAGMLHDIGAFSLKERVDLLEFESTKPGQHAMAGYLLLKDFAPFDNIARIVRYHHKPWKNGKGEKDDGMDVPMGSHLIHLADRVAVLISKDRAVLSQVGKICKTLEKNKGDMFVPEYVDSFIRLAKKDYIWHEATSKNIEAILRRNLTLNELEVNLDTMLDFSRLMGRVVDFRSEYTATHSSVVAAIAGTLSRIMRFSTQECTTMQIAAYLHDLGKLAIPREILEKSGKLSKDEYHAMRSYVYYTYQILERIEVLNNIALWAGLHQERTDGSGYPFGYDEERIPLGARIMAVADVFAALTEDRPYRKSMTKKRAILLLESMTENEQLDPQVVGALLDHYDTLDLVKNQAHEEAAREYGEFQKAVSAEQ